MGGKQRGEDDFGGGEDEEDEDEAAGDQSIGEDGSSASSDEDVDGETWKGDEDEEVERPIKAICMYAAIRPIANIFKNRMLISFLAGTDTVILTKMMTPVHNMKIR